MSEGLRVLLVEDNPGDARLIRAMLREGGRAPLSLEHCDRLAVGLERLARGDINVVLLDLGLPDSQGLDTFDRLHASAPQMPIVVFSGLNDETRALEAVQRGAQDYLVKGSIDSHLLLRSIHYAVERRRIAEALRVSNRFLEIVNRHAQMSPLLDEFVNEAREFSGVASVAVGLFNERKGLSFRSHVGFGEAFLRSESPLVAGDGCLCTQVVMGMATPAPSTSTEAGSHYVNAITAMRASLPPQAREALCSVCQRAGYESVALIPIRVSGRLIGIIHLADPKENMLPRETVHLLEAAAVALGMAVERVRTEETLARERYFVDTLMEHVPDRIFFKDADSRFIRVNRAVADYFGLSSPAEAVGKNDADYFSDERARQAIADEQEMMASGRPIIAKEEKLTRTDGSVSYASVTKLPLRDAQGRIIGTCGISRDITANKEAEQALRESERKFRSIVERSTEGITLTDEAGLIIEWNEAQERITGRARHNVLGCPLWDVQFQALPAGRRTPALYERLREGLLSVLERRDGDWLNRLVETEVERTDGSRCDMELSTFSIATDRGVMMGSVSRDVTERKRMGEALRLSEEMYRTLVESVDDSIHIKDRQGRYMLVNSQLVRHVGRSKEDIVGKTALHLYPEELARRIMADDLRVIELDTTVDVEEELPWVGGPKVVLTRKVPLRNTKGEVTGIVTISRDVTERRRLEDQLRQAQKMEAVGRLAGGVAHDFNNILTVILGHASFAAEALLPEDPVREDIAEVVRSANRAASLTRQLLAFSRRQVLDPKVLDLNELILDMDKMLHRLLGEDIELLTLPAPGLGPVKVDPGQIEQVIMNLAVNARDAMPDGGRLLIETANVTLDEDYAARHLGATPGEHILLSVTDTGSGMTDEVKARIFEPFFTTKGPDKGTGLGLATVYGIVKQHQGSIWVYSELGRGTTFKVYLPRVEEEARYALRQPESAELPQGSETILVAEDESAVRAITVRALRRLGYTILEAANGPEALQVVGNTPGKIDLLVTDVIMPGMNGNTLAERLRAVLPDIRTLFVSGYTENAIAHRSLLEEGVAFLQKPLTVAALAHKVRQVLDGEPFSSRGA